MKFFSVICISSGYKVFRVSPQSSNLMLGLRVSSLGTTSVTFEVGLFSPTSESVLMPSLDLRAFQHALNAAVSSLFVPSVSSTNIQLMPTSSSNASSLSAFVAAAAVAAIHNATNTNHNPSITQVNNMSQAPLPSASPSSSNNFVSGGEDILALGTLTYVLIHNRADHVNSDGTPIALSNAMSDVLRGFLVPRTQ